MRPLKLQEIYSYFFSSRIKLWGEECLRRQRADLTSTHDNISTFLIVGSSFYTCKINCRSIRSKRFISVSCTCPDFESGNYCKHIWTSFLKGDEHHLLDTIELSGIKRIDLRRESPHLLDDSEDDFYEDDDLKEEIYRSLDLPIGKHQSPSKWQNVFDSIAPKRSLSFENNLSKREKELCYVIDLNMSFTRFYSSFCIQLFHKTGPRPGQKKMKISLDDLQDFKDVANREILALLFSATETPPFSYNRHGGSRQRTSTLSIPSGLEKTLLRKMCLTNKLYVSGSLPQGSPQLPHNSSSQHLTLLEENQLLSFDVIRDEDQYKITSKFIGSLHHEGIKDVICHTASGSILSQSYIAFYDPKDFHWDDIMRKISEQKVPISDGNELVRRVYSQDDPPEMNWPEELQWEKISTKPQPKLLINTAKQNLYEKTGLYAEVRFQYGKKELSSLSKSKFSFHTEDQQIYVRNFEAEQICLDEAAEHDLSEPQENLKGQYNFKIKKELFSQVVSSLLEKNWEVEANGQSVKRATDFTISVSSGVNWFDLNAEVKFESGLALPLPQLLESLKTGQHLIPLGDGGLAMLPEEWLNKYACLAELGESNGDSIRYTKSQGIFLDGLLNQFQEATFDLDFKKFREKLKKFKLQKEKEPSRYFKGELRPYQKTGLSWLDYLQTFEIGGILADDMGLGKTIQVLSFLQKQAIRQKRTHTHKPSIIVVPKSLVFNWESEAKKFTPSLKVLSFVGAKRGEDFHRIMDHDIIVTTYHTLRMDYEKLREINFYGIILDEAQAIKNPRAKISQICKGLQGGYKLALTGTPIENSITDLFSIMDFVNPGLINANLKESFKQTHANIDEHRKKKLEPLSRALSPLILRRTKDEVLTDLPPKSVSILRCTLSQEERKRYEELKSYYQKNLSKKIQEKGLKK